LVIVWVKMEYSEGCVVMFRKKHSLSSGDVTIASVLASIDAMSAEFRSGRVLACSQNIAK